MHLLPALFLLLTASTNAYFTLNSLTTDFQFPLYTVNFTVINSEPGTIQIPTQCELHWPVESICYITCGNLYFARITPDSFKSSADFSIDLAQEVYTLSTIRHQNATVKISTRERGAGYRCNRGGNRCAIVPGSKGFRGEASDGFGLADRGLFCEPAPIP
ncbi:hypothetical protein K470DRAFT_279287 [Piedraia hortae CBS 480.64]|uniref:Uncharacterized protein n=1 Tax=Piedraia hortae CBS 480.64 TaxID=1314780 RepID=A0A6A7BQG1_9PEZI|nr:hypothetical protein K470DRAFT_279287 [Piedraia hortae CBS 480.64]